MGGAHGRAYAIDGGIRHSVSRGSCVVGLLLFIDDKFEEWAWSCELTSFWPAAATVGIPASLWFRSCASHSQTGASQSRQSTEISIFTVSTYVSLGCSGNTTWIMRRTLDISFAFHSIRRSKQSGIVS
nr:hypothetical protein [Tanacetum cinerariifolium]